MSKRELPFLLAVLKLIGHLICIHDDTADRTTSGKGRISELTLAQIRDLDAGSWFEAQFAGEKVPTIEEVLRLIAEYRRHPVLIAVDLKAQGVEQEVVRLAEKHDVLDRLLFIGRVITEPTVRSAIRESSRKAHVAAVANVPNEHSKAVSDAHSDWVYVRYIPSQVEIDAARRSGKRTFIAGSTVSGKLPDYWQKAAGVGIDAILTDYPLDLRTVLRGTKF